MYLSKAKRGYGGLMFSLVCIIGIKLLLYLRTVLHCIAHAIVQTPYFILRHYRGCQSKRKYCCKYNSFHCYIIFYLIKCKERAKTVKTLYHNMLTNSVLLPSVKKLDNTVKELDNDRHPSRVLFCSDKFDNGIKIVGHMP